MENNKEPTQKKSSSRRNFVGRLGVLSLFSALAAAMAGRPFPVKKNILSCAPEPKKKMVKMLTQDGQLVEIDESLLPAKGKKKISDVGLRNWIKNKI